MKFSDIVERRVKLGRNINAFSTSDGSKSFYAGNVVITISHDAEYDPQLHDRVIYLLGNVTNNPRGYSCKWIASKWALKAKSLLTAPIVVTVIDRRVISDMALSYKEERKSEPYYIHTIVSVEDGKVVIQRTLNDGKVLEFSDRDEDLKPTDIVLTAVKNQIDHS